MLTRRGSRGDEEAEEKRKKGEGEEAEKRNLRRRGS
jgi:hypothetical protein